MDVPLYKVGLGYWRNYLDYLELFKIILQLSFQVRPFNADKTRNMRSLNPEDIDQLITISGMVIRTSNLIPEMSEALFR